MQALYMREPFPLPKEFRRTPEEQRSPPMMVDLFKYTKIGAIIDVLEMFANSPYRFGENKPLRAFLQEALWRMPLGDCDLLWTSLCSEPPTN